MTKERVSLPEPDSTGTTPLETLLSRRHSEREFSDHFVELATLSQLLWAGLGRNRPSGGRTVASAGALYPLELYVVAGDVRNLPSGIYRYDGSRRALERSGAGDRRGDLARAAVGQLWVADAPLIIVVAAVDERTTVKYGDRGVRYARMEAGLVAQNICLQTEALGLGTTLVGAFDDDRVSELLGLPGGTLPLALLPIGTPAAR